MTGTPPPETVAAQAAVCRRRDDRRRLPTPLLSRYTLLGGRRSSGGRRVLEHTDCFVDVHGAALFAVVVAIVALNFLDAWFTVLFLSHGGQEMNPLVEGLLAWGTLPFVFVKSLGIGLCVLILTIAKNFRFARFGLGIVLLGYLALLGWHAFLYSYLP